jgi:glutamine synthetase
MSDTQAVLSKYLSLDQHGKIMAEYIWIGGSGQDLRSKTRTFDAKINNIKQLPDWNYDGSSTDQAPGHNSEVIIKARAIFKDPFRGGDNILVICDTYEPNGTPLPTNTRHPANEIFEQAKEHEPWFGLEQEYTLFSIDRNPLGWPKGGFPAPQGPYYCGVGADKAFGRYLVDAHYKACLYAGVKIAGCNGEVMPGQWEFQVGPCVGVDIGDHLWTARYLMHRIAEEFGIIVSFHPKPILGDWNGAGCHTNYSTKETRAENGIVAIFKQIEKLSHKHKEHIEVYGSDNELRLTGKHETAKITEFRSGVADRGASIRIPSQVDKDKSGYYEDRRPASNCDPYTVAARIVQTTLL